MKLSLGVLVSGSGSNLQAILDSIADGSLQADLRIVISNRPGVLALERAQKAGVPTALIDHRQFSSREEFDEVVVAELQRYSVQWVALAGFMRVVTRVLLAAFPDRIVNIHPSLLPAFPGVDAQKQAFNYGVKVTGCTVHFVDDGVDSGPVIAQRSVNVLADDDLATLRERILAEEHVVFPEVLRAIAQGRVEVVRREGIRPTVRVLDEHEPSALRSHLEGDVAR